MQEGKSSADVGKSWKRAHLEMLLFEIQRKPPAPSTRQDGKGVEGGRGKQRGREKHSPLGCSCP